MDELEGTLEVILSNFSIRHEETKSWGHTANYLYEEHQIAETGSEILVFPIQEAVLCEVENPAVPLSALHTEVKHVGGTQTMYVRWNGGGRARGRARGGQQVSGYFLGKLPLTQGVVVSIGSFHSLPRGEEVFKVSRQTDAGHRNTNGPEIFLYLSLPIKVLNFQLPTGQALNILQATVHHMLQTQALGDLRHWLSLGDKSEFLI